jgi:glycosyltransferase involved in cell wall biosynthesis
MRLLVVSQYFWPENFRINEIVQSLTEKGFEVEVLTGKPNYPIGVFFPGYQAWGCMTETRNGVSIHRVPTLPRGKSALRLALNYLSFIASGIFMAPWVLRRKPFDAIFVVGLSPVLQAIPAISLGIIKKCAVVLWVQDLWPESLLGTGYIHNTKLLKIVELVVGLIYRNVDLLLVQSPAFIPKVQALAAGTPIHYYPNSFIQINQNGLNASVNSSNLEVGFSVLFAGNLGSAQALDVIIDAAELLKNFEEIRFVIIGDGSKREWMMREASRRNLISMTFPGHFPLEAMPSIMSKASVLLATLADTEIFRLTIPSKIQAYLSAGRPIVASLSGAGADLISEAKAGIAVPSGNTEELAKAILSLYRMTVEERNELGANGSKYFNMHFSHDNLTNKLIGHIKNSINRYRGLDS